MSDKWTAPEVKPEVVFLFDLLREVVSGRLRIPNFQRPFVWRRDQMLDLLDSIRRQYPIGSLMVWETDEKLSSMSWVGPIQVPDTPAGTVGQLLDGHQRLSTLTGVLMPRTGSSAETDEDPERWDVWYNASSDQFEHLRGATKEPEAWHFPMSKLMDTYAFLNECKRILDTKHKDAQAFVEKVQQLARNFQAYKLPVIRFRNTDLRQAVEIFARLNSKGQHMTADQMLTALVYKEGGFNLAEHIQEIRDALGAKGFGRVDRTIILRALLAAAKEDVYKTDWTRLRDPGKGELEKRLEQTVEPTKDALIRATDFLHTIGVHNDRLLPYSMQLVLLSVFFSACETPTEQQNNFLRRWFWVSSFTGWFASGNPSRVTWLIDEFRDVAKNPAPTKLQNIRLEEPALPIPKMANMLSARYRTHLLVLLGQNPKDWINGQSIPEPWRRIEEFGSNALGNIMALNNHREWLSSPANRVLRREARDRSQAKKWIWDVWAKDSPNGPEQGSPAWDILISHAIPPVAVPLLRDNPEAFLKQRLDYLIELERKFMEENGVTPPHDTTPQPAPIDTDDGDDD